MANQPGHVWALIQRWLDTFTYRPPSQRELAPRLGVSNSTLGDYKYARHMPPPAFVVRLAEEIQAPYETVLDAVLKDHGYRGESLEAIRRGTTTTVSSDQELADRTEAAIRQRFPREPDTEAGTDIA